MYTFLLIVPVVLDDEDVEDKNGDVDDKDEYIDEDEYVDQGEDENVNEITVVQQ